jgi:hypothetical protein
MQQNLNHTALAVILLAVFGSVSPTDARSDQTEKLREVRKSDAPAPVYEEMQWKSAPPVFTPAERAEMKRRLKRSHLSPQVVPGDVTEGLVAPGSRERSTVKDSEKSPEPNQSAPEDNLILHRVLLTDALTGLNTDNRTESSVAVGGRELFFTGNWFAARSTDGGETWTFVDPRTGMSDFCCDQIAMYDDSCDMFIWLRMATFPPSEQQIQAQCVH